MELNQDTCRIGRINQFKCTLNEKEKLFYLDEINYKFDRPIFHTCTTEYEKQLEEQLRKKFLL